MRLGRYLVDGQVLPAIDDGSGSACRRCLAADRMHYQAAGSAMNYWSFVPLAAVVLLLPTPSRSASEATVANLQGLVQISRAGGPFTNVAGPTACGAGDVLRVVGNGSAQVVNPNGVIQTATLGAPVKCLAGIGSPSPTFVGGPDAAADAALPATGQITDAAAAASASSKTGAILVGSGIVAAASVAGVVALNRKSAASP
jgi:hypothetical protein